MVTRTSTVQANEANFVWFPHEIEKRHNFHQLPTNLLVTGPPGSGKRTPNFAREVHRLCNFIELQRVQLEAHYTIRERKVHGRVNGHKIEALPDTGADGSYISQSLLKRLRRLRREQDSQWQPIEEFAAPSSVRLASGKTIKTTRAARIPWQFEGESSLSWVTCHVLPQGAHGLILGDSFLRETKTLTAFKSRIKTTVRVQKRDMLSSMRLNLNYMGCDRHHLRGFLDGELVSALPDSGSDIMAVSAEYARKRGFVVDRRHDRQVEVQFADGSTAWTDGVASQLKWEFGDTGKEVVSDFYVLDHLPVDVLLSSDFVFGHDVFVEHEGAFFDHGSVLGLLDLCNIRLIGNYSRDLERLEEEELIDLASPDAFSPLMVQRELARRDAIRESIPKLPLANRALAQQAEAERQRQWDHLREEHFQRWANAAPPDLIPGPSIGSSESSSSTSLGGTARFLRAGRWARRHVRMVAIPLVPLRGPVPMSAEDHV
ncbi:hypothetical protein N658DRAFT_421339 [Parathielavia hyrcaniae]|uniref:Uncharacterized protein n=1 Tax=Parathielavia hyrcaniae TaxID=113614 RepID=A0AAN6T468_9PEZI|nr:hypothetical protein N658DRAFT_421339 [Parathielavia hyrcaniae]